MKALLTISILSAILGFCIYINPANAGQKVIIVCNPDCNPVVIVTPDSTDIDNPLE